MKKAIFLMVMLLFILRTGFCAMAMSVEGDTAVFEGKLSFTQPAKGAWAYQNGKWKYANGQGFVCGKWLCIESADGNREWYCFDSEGNMCTGWQKSSSGNWYYLRETPDSRMGAMEHGFLLEPTDGHVYYLNPDTGAMRTGWVEINGNEYYFSEGGDAASWYWNPLRDRWEYNGNGTRPLGSMYVSERTPDGRFADATGVCLFAEGGGK